MPILYLEIGQNRRELFSGERGYSGPTSGKRAIRILVLSEPSASLFSDPGGGLADYSGINRLLLRIDNIVGNLFGLLFVQEVAVVFFHNPLKIIGQALVNDDSLLRSADHTVIKGLGKHQVGAGSFQISDFSI